jgi:hypothetical protein
MPTENSVALLIGDKQRFAAEVGEFWKGDTRYRCVDLWAAGRCLTCDDNTAFVPQFCMSVRSTFNWLRSLGDLTPPFPGLSPPETHRRLREMDDESDEQFWFPQWGPTTDNLVGCLFRVGERVVFTFEFWRESHPVPEERGVLFVTNLLETEFVGVLEQLLAALGCGE